MKTLFNLSLAVALFISAIELAGCSAPPPPPKSAKSEIGAATSAIETAKALTLRSQFEQAITEYDRALEEINNGQKFAKGTELTQLDNLKKEVRLKKTELETLAMRAAAMKAKKPAVVADAPKVEDPEIVRKKLETEKAAELAAQNKDVLATPTKTAPKAKVDEADETEVANKDGAKKDGAKDPAGKTEDGTEAPKAVRKDKTGVYPDITEKSPAMEIVKIERVGRFSVAYCQLYNNTDNGKRITVATFFKDRDNQIIIEPRTTVAFPYEHFSTKVKDLIADQSVRNLAANAEEVGGHEFLQFVCVGESTTDEKAKLVAKAYVNILFSDGSTAEATSNSSVAESNDLVKGLVKKPESPKPPAPKK